MTQSRTKKRQPSIESMIYRPPVEEPKPTGDETQTDNNEETGMSEGVRLQQRAWLHSTGPASKKRAYAV